MVLQQSTSSTVVRKASARRHDRGRLMQEAAMLAPAVILLTLFLIVPFLLSFWTAMTNQPLVPRPTPVRFVWFNNFIRIFQDDLFWTALWNVSRFTFWIIPAQCGLAFATALLLHQKLPFRNLLRGMFFLPAITSMVVVCVIWGTLFQYPTGPFNQILGFLSGGAIQPIDWLGDPQWAMFSLVLLSAWQAYGFQMIVYLAGLQGIPDELYDAAKIDGANAFRRFWHVTMPGLRPTHVFVLVITTIQAFKLYTQVAILTQGGPKSSTETVVHYMVRAGFEEQKMGYASAVSVILFVIVLVIALIQRQLLRRFDV
ncbi:MULTISPECIES: carbohydrate ABC transporter permease [Rhizobium]|uniref:carbohydrate ABC transporter permease n=1 Tax=Rhizobium phaseoli TaxID=396 RepID=UPI0002FE16CA|nr:sugar ABC transporter permease [Rhizobium phaseoli]ANL56498.1 sugar ABC transporter permease protein [Rhizobium phaseoli]ARM15953.1 sugar ABC transporter permease protein [Rhizobium phaseoli Brasil 5]KKZ83321.1 putative sucrose ABC transporter permease [Rhizobium phaseoli Ch24-10]MDK4730493.1 sugar ABC transporter permease [Rhizobium phaseoli]NKE90332.1 sugar ABC transporter permease [Rhizobium phaseoli]